MKCENCGNETHGGYCDCMIINGEFKGDWWNENKKDEIEKLYRYYMINYDNSSVSKYALMQFIYELYEELKKK